MTAALIYTRVSTIEQVENLSLDTQERECRAHCRREGLKVDRVFREEGESAKTTNRTQLQELLAYCAAEAKRRDISVLIVYRVDRLARDVHDHTAIRATLMNRGVTVRAVTESFDDSPSGKFIENVMAATAQFDNDLRSVRTMDGMKEALRRGRWVWQAPLGYLRTDRHTPMSMIHDPDTAPLVLHSFEAIASRRLTKVETVAELTGFGLHTRRGNRLSPQSLGKMLNNPLYMGRIINLKWEIDVEGDFVPVVDPVLFRRVQEVLNGRAPARSSRAHDNPDFPLRRVVRCRQCSSPLTGSWSTGRSRRYPYYRCPKKGCGGSNVRKERLEELLVNRLGEMSLRAELLDLVGAVVKDAWKERVNTSEAAQKALTARLWEVEKKRDTLVDAYLDGRGIDQATFERQTKRLDNNEAELRNRIDVAHPTEVDLTRAIDLAQAMLVDLPSCWNRLEPQHRHQFIAALYPAGLTYEDGTIGTVENPWWMATSAAIAAEKMGLVPPTGFEPVLPA